MAEDTTKEPDKSTAKETTVEPAKPGTPITGPQPQPQDDTVLEPETVKASKSPKCPHCGDALDVYEGTNDLKQNTAFCHRCGLRHHLKG